MAHLDVAFSEAREGLKAAAAGRGGGAGPGVDASSGNQAGEEEGGGGASAAAAAALLEQEDDVAVVVEKSVDDDTAGPPPSTAASASFSSASASSAAEEGGAAAIRPFSRPGYVGRAGYQSKRTVRRLPRVFPSSLVMNAQRAEGLFQRHYAKVQQEAQAPAGAETGADAAAGQGDGAKTAAIQGASAAGEQPQPQQQQPQQGLRPRGSRRQQQKELKEQAASVAEQGPGTNGGVAAAGAGQQLQRQDSAVSAALSSPARSAATRATRSRTGKGVMDDWAKIPVTVMTRINKASPELVPVDGVVFVSMEDGRESRFGVVGWVVVVVGWSVGESGVSYRT